MSGESSGHYPASYWETRLAEAQARMDAFENRETSNDPAVVNLSASSRNRAAASAGRRRAAAMDADLDRYKELRAAVSKCESRLSSARAREAESSRRHLTREEIEGASLIHDGHTWRKVVRVNAKSVSVESGYSWVDRVPFDKIHAVQPAMFPEAE